MLLFNNYYITTPIFRLPKRYLIIFIFLQIAIQSQAQSYHALKGSAYAGAVAGTENPAALVNSYFKWDATLFSAQASFATTLANVSNLSLSTPENITIKIPEGYRSRYLHAAADISLLSIRYLIQPDKAIGFSITGRVNNHLKTSSFNYNDSITGLRGFFSSNLASPFAEANGVHSAWLSYNLSYAQTISHHALHKWNWGVTLHIMQGLSGAYGSLNRTSFYEDKTGSPSTYIISNGGAGYVYSKGYDMLDGRKDAKENIKLFRDPAKSSLGLSTGFEYVMKQTDDPAEDYNPLNYKWKISAAIMDIGKNTFLAGKGSKRMVVPLNTASDSTLTNLYNGTEYLDDFIDTLSFQFARVDTLYDPFSITNPTRMAINADYQFKKNLFLNIAFSGNLFSAFSGKQQHTRELNLITVTPRWETAFAGLYLPVQFNTQGQFWLGTAIKIGPLVAGVHHLPGLLRKQNIVNGGGYLMLRIHPYHFKKKQETWKCPE